MMKRIITPIVLFVFALTVNAQSSIDRLFDRYQGVDGFVTVTVSGSFLKLAGHFDDDEDLLKYADKFSSIRILAQEDDNMDVENFHDMIMDELENGGYEEMVRVNSSDTDLKIMVKAEGDIFSEFLLVTGGEDNVLIQIKGRMTEKMMKEIAEDLEDDNRVFGMR